jgi:ABC-type Fe3+-hydroxamate transport system substrate-binding protein
MRVVSLLPSATELFLAINRLDDRSRDGGVSSAAAALVGRSHECDWPPPSEYPALARLPVLTAARTTFESSAQIDHDVREHLAKGESLYRLDTSLLASLRPDLIITQDLCEVCSIDLESVRLATAAMSPRPAVLSLNPHTVEDVFDDLLRIGAATGMESLATRAYVEMRERMYRATEIVPGFADRPVTVFLDWTDPLFVGGHWTPQLIERAGGDHPLNPTSLAEGSDGGAADGPIGQTLRRAGKSIRAEPGAVAAARPAFLFIAPCGLPLEQAVRETDALAGQDWFEGLPAVRTARTRASGSSAQEGGVWCIDGAQMFNRPGPRLVEAQEFLAAVLQGREDIMPPGFPCVRWRARR